MSRIPFASRAHTSCIILSNPHSGRSSSSPPLPSLQNLLPLLLLLFTHCPVIYRPNPICLSLHLAAFPCCIHPSQRTAAHPHHLTVHLCCWWLLNGSRYLAVKQLHIACSTGQYWRRSRQWGGSAPNTTTINAGGSLSLPGPAHPPPLVVSLIPLTHGFCHRCVVHRNTSPL